MSNLKKELGLRIKELRKSRGYTQSQLAEHTDLSDNFIGYIERGDTTPSLESLEKIALALNVKVEDLFRFKDNQTTESEQALFELIDYLKNKDVQTIKLISQIIKMIFQVESPP